MNPTAYYFAPNYDAWTCGTPYAIRMFHDGFHDRDDKIVDWVIRHYCPGDGRPRSPLKLRRDVSQQPAISTAGITFIVDPTIKAGLLRLGAAVEFLEVVFVKPFRLSTLAGLSECHDDDEIEAYIAANARPAATQPEARFELIAPVAESAFNPPARSPVRVTGVLKRCRTVDLKPTIDVTVDQETLARSQVMYAGGAGLICLPAAAEVLRASADAQRFAIEPLSLSN